MRWISGLLVVLAIGLPLVIPSSREALIEGCKLLLVGEVDGLHAWAKQLGIWAPLATSSLMLAQALAAPIPAVLITITNALLFGWFWGACLSIFSATVAASVCFYLGSLLGPLWMDRWVKQETQDRWQSVMDNHGGYAILAARLMPFVPFDPISYLAGMGKMRFSIFFLMTLIGQIPAGFAYSYLGSQLNQPNKLWITALCIALGLGVMGLAVRKWMKRKSASVEIEV